MSNLYERIQAENRKLKQEGKQEGRQEGRKIEKLEMIRNMVYMKISDEIIRKVGNINQEELIKIKKELNIVA